MSSRSQRRLLPLAALGVVVLPVAFVALGAAPAAAAATCDGQPATIVGSYEGGYTLTGTSGNDVIVTNGSTIIDAGAGNDLICITTDYGHAGGDFVNSLRVDAGPGNDMVDVVTDPDGSYARQTVVSLGTGADEFTGSSSADEFVYGAAPGVADNETDTIGTGSGNDDVVVGDGGVLTDRVTVGAGSSVLQIDASSMSPDALVQGAAGVRLRFVGAVTGAYEIDGATGEVTRAGDAQPSFVWSGFTSYDWEAPTLLGFTGTAAPETVSAAHLVYADLGGGDDTVATGPAAGDRHLTGGSGVDTVQLLSAGATGSVDVDLPRKRVRFSSGEPIASISGFETYRINAGRSATFTGSPRADVVAAFACYRVDLSGAGGSDLLVVDPSDGLLLPRQRTCRNAKRSIVTVDAGHGDDRVVDSDDAGRLKGSAGDDAISGGPGDDVISGGPGDDRLDGELGRDQVDGYTGRDTCRGEKLTRCER